MYEMAHLHPPHPTRPPTYLIKLILLEYALHGRTRLTFRVFRGCHGRVTAPAPRTGGSSKKEGHAWKIR